MKKNTSFSILMFGLGLGFTGCKQDCSLQSSNPPSVNSTSASTTCTTPSPSQTPLATSLPTPSAVPTPVVTPVPSPTIPDVSAYPLLWDAARPEGKTWSIYLKTVIRDEVANDLLPGTSDMAKFCPKYSTLNNEQRVNVWALLISAVVKFESDFDPTSRMLESTMGTDPVTGQHVYSEGLMQLSYQDKEWAPYCEFDWSKDRLLSATDPRKTILDPKINLNCGTKILAAQVKKHGIIAAPASYAYWAVLIPNGKYTELNNIASLTQKMPGCL